MITLFSSLWQSVLCHFGEPFGIISIFKNLSVEFSIRFRLLSFSLLLSLFSGYLHTTPVASSVWKPRSSLHGERIARLGCFSLQSSSRKGRVQSFSVCELSCSHRCSPVPCYITLLLLSPLHRQCFSEFSNLIPIPLRRNCGARLITVSSFLCNVSDSLRCSFLQVLYRQSMEHSSFVSFPHFP